MKKIVYEWETLDDHTYRVKVFGGWMVVAETVSNKGNISSTSVFVPDRDHEWMPLKPVEIPVEKKEPVPAMLKKD